MESSYKVVEEKTGRYLPVIYPEELPFWEGARKHEIVLQRCNACAKSWYPIGPACPHCFSMSFKWDRMSGRGTLHNYVVFHKPWTKWFESKVPYAVVQVQLEEGPILISNIDQDAVPDLKAGVSVKMIYGSHPDGYTLPRFQLAGADRP